MNKKECERFEFDSFSQRIYDNLTGKSYSKLSEITRLLNKECERANNNAEQFDKYYEKFYEYKIKSEKYDELKKKEVLFHMIIERNEDEYLEEIKELYDVKIKPLLNEGYSLTKALKTLKISSGKNRKRNELKKLAMEDGYILQR